MPPEAENLSRAVDILKALGKVHLAKGQYREAAERYEQIIRMGVREPQVYQQFAVALAGQKLYTPDTCRIYDWALNKFPHDKNLSLHVAIAALHNGAEDECAQRYYETALKFYPPFAKDIYLRLHKIFHRQAKFDEAFQALKQALYLEKSDDPELVTRLTHLGWRYNRQEELIMTLRFLLGNHEENETIRRALAFSLAHAIILHRRQAREESDFPLQNENDWPLLHASLPAPEDLDTLAKVRDYSTLQLALQYANKHGQDFLAASPASTPNGRFLKTAGPKAFEYRALLDEQPLEELLANASAPQKQPPTALAATKPATSKFDWQRDFLACLSQIRKSGEELQELASSETPAVEAATTSSPNEKSRPSFAKEINALIVLTPEAPRPSQSPEANARQPGSNSPTPQFIEIVAQQFAAADPSILVYALNDGIMAFSTEPKRLAATTITLFKKVSRYNTSLPEQNQIMLHAALHTREPSPASVKNSSQENSNKHDRTGLELLYYTLHLLQAESGERTNEIVLRSALLAPRLLPAPRRHRLLMTRRTFDSVLSAPTGVAGHFAAKFWGPVYWGAPGLQEEIGELIWYNPLEFASEKRPYALSRFLVVERLQAWQAYGTYRGRDRSLERPVVLKVLHPEIYSPWRENSAHYAETVNAIRRLGRLEHPGMALIYDMGEQAELFFFAREYIEGENLAQTLDHNKRLPPAIALRLIIAACRIIKHAHRFGVYHHNLKPSNIWQLTPVTAATASHEQGSQLALADFQIRNGDIKISDFFIPGFNETAGANWHYTAPELLFQKATGNGSNPAAQSPAAIDVFALGVILYECLCGRNPFAQISRPASLSAWEAVPITAPSKIEDNPASTALPPIGDEIVLQAIHQAPQQRFQTVADLEAALQEVLNQLPAETPAVMDDQASMAEKT
ncbi:protein kinase [candidate division KSB1 bacterium]|nr:protein kinase [candidate division KSB1 bacterium]